MSSPDFAEIYESTLVSLILPRPRRDREMRRVLADRGRVVISTWRSLAENPLFEGLDAAAARQFGPRADRRFSLGDESAICALLTEAGFREISAKIIAQQHFFPDAESFIPLNLWATVPELDEMSEEDRRVSIARLKHDAAETLDRFRSGAGLQHTMRTNVVTASIVYSIAL